MGDKPFRLLPRIRSHPSCGILAFSEAQQLCRKTTWPSWQATLVLHLLYPPGSCKFLPNADSLNKLKVSFLCSITLRVPAQQTSCLLTYGSVWCFLSEKHWCELRRIRRFHWLPFCNTKRSRKYYFGNKSFYSAHCVPESESHAFIIFCPSAQTQIGFNCR